MAIYYTKSSSYLSNIGMIACVVVLVLTLYAIHSYMKAEHEAWKAQKAEQEWEAKQAQIKADEEHKRAMEAYRQELLEKAKADQQAARERYEAEKAREEAEEAEWQAACERALAEAKQKRAERRTTIRAEMDPDLVSLLDELNLFDRMTHYDETLGEAFYRIGIKTITILAGRNAGGGGGIQPQKLEKEYRVPAGVAVDLKQKAIARLQRPARSPARVRPAAANTA